MFVSLWDCFPNFMKVIIQKLVWKYQKLTYKTYVIFLTSIKVFFQIRFLTRISYIIIPWHIGDTLRIPQNKEWRTENWRYFQSVLIQELLKMNNFTLANLKKLWVLNEMFWFLDIIILPLIRWPRLGVIENKLTLFYSRDDWKFWQNYKTISNFC